MDAMKPKFLSIYLVSLVPCLFFIPGCRSVPHPEETSIKAPQFKQDYYVILDYKNKAQGAALPRWLDDYFTAGPAAVEMLYWERYAFIAANQGDNFRALGQWSDAFSPPQDFPRLAEARMSARVAQSTQYPEETYGRFYEDLIRMGMDEGYSGAIKRDDCWVRRRHFWEDGQGGIQSEETWEFFVLVTIPRRSFRSQVENLLERVAEAQGTDPPRKQFAAFTALKEHFFEGF
jgi:hypothetical protein